MTLAIPLFIKLELSFTEFSSSCIPANTPPFAEFFPSSGDDAPTAFDVESAAFAILALFDLTADLILSSVSVAFSWDATIWGETMDGVSSEDVFRPA
mmetsp:Transcript_69748/g.145425  ORF Transcript_69748/g.145425 Transcript_69748/m.145425 type:complete len:97 (-) Transcript_69748:402-692(-)